MTSLPKSNGKTILVTGINGYIASATVLRILEAGYNVCGTSRRKSSVKHLLEGGLKPYAERITIYEVPDMTVPGAFDEAVKGVYGIAHTASPIDFSVKEADAFLIPAVKGVEILLESAVAHGGPQLQSVVITSSVASIVGSQATENPGHVFTEADWNDLSPRRVKELGDEAPGGVKYAASKVAAERAAWAFRDTHKPSFAISTCNPSVVTGPSVELPEKPEWLNETLMPVWNILSGNVKELPPPVGTAGHVDVRDVAYAHLWCIENPEEANGQRFMLVNGQGKPQAMVDIINKLFPERSGIIVKGEPGKDYDPDFGWWKGGGFTIDNSKATKAMGIKWIRFDQSIEETAKAMAAKWLK